MPKLGLGISLNKIKKNASSLILDQFDGAAAAYSLRYLSSSYTGDVVLVRRSSDNTEEGFTPTEITDGTLEAFCGVGDGFVKTWYCQVNSLNDATQTTASEQPKIVSSGSLIVKNSIPSIEFDGTSNNLLCGANPISGTAGFSLIAVGQADTTASAETIWGTGNLSGSAGNSYHLTSEIAVRVAGNALFSSDYISVNPSLLFNYYPESATTSDIVLYINGSLIAQLSDTSTALNIDDTFGTRIGRRTDGGGLFDGSLSELIIYDSSQSANRTAIETAINSYYSIY